MKTNLFIKCIAMLILFTGVTVFSFADTFFNISTGPYWVNDEYIGDDYSRAQSGVLTNFTFYFFPENTPLGFQTQLSIGVINSGSEFKPQEEEMRSLNISSSDLRVSAAPAFMLKLGEKVGMPFSLGPVFSFCWEDGSGYGYIYDDIDIDEGSTSVSYESFGLGLLANIGIYVNPYKFWSLMSGVMLDWDFLRFERGEMPTTYRDSRNFTFVNAPYSALVLSFYFGMGVYFE